MAVILKLLGYLPLSLSSQVASEGQPVKTCYIAHCCWASPFEAGNPATLRLRRFRSSAPLSDQAQARSISSLPLLPRVLACAVGGSPPVLDFIATEGW